MFHGRDKYDRHLIGLYYLNDVEEKKVLKEEIFLNQELLNKGLVDYAK